MPTKDIEKRRKYRRDWYYRNKGKQIARNLAKRRAKLESELESIKRGLHCIRCGIEFKDCPECCDLHHVDPDNKKYIV